MYAELDPKNSPESENYIFNVCVFFFDRIGAIKRRFLMKT